MLQSLKFWDGTDEALPRLTGVPVFREGDYQPQGSYSADDVREMAETYDPLWIEAPLTPDHEQNGFAWGWWERFYAVEAPFQGEDGETSLKLELYGDVGLLPPGEFIWKSGLMKKRSIEVWREFELRGRAAGHYVKAVSLLGAATPAVKGLRDMFRQFASSLKTDAALKGKSAFLKYPDVKVQAFSVEYEEVNGVLRQKRQPKVFMPAIGKELDPNQPPAAPAGFNTVDLTGVFSDYTGLLSQFPEGATVISANGQKYRLQPCGEEDETGKDNNMHSQNGKPSGQQAANSAENVTISAAQFAQFQEALASVGQFGETLAALKTQNETLQASLNQANVDRQAEAEARFRVTEDARFDAELKKHRDKVSPALATLYRALFHGSPADTETDRHVSFKSGARDVTKSMRSVILDCMACGAQVIDLNQDLQTDNETAIEEGQRKRVPALDTQEFFDRRAELAEELENSTDQRFCGDAKAALAEAHRRLVAAQPASARRGKKRASIPAA